MINNGVLELYEDLTDPIIRNRFPVYADLAAKGATGYFAILTPFGDPETALVRHDGVITSWATDKADGFSPTHLDAIRGVIPHIALTARLAKSVYTARNVVNAYLGEDVGHRVLSGQIRLGDSQTIPAVIWYSDLRESTAMAERLGPEVFLRALNEYFECSAGAVLAHHGEVLRFVGDAVLAVFPISQTQDATEAAANACAAASEGRQRLQTLNVRRLAEHDEALDFGVALHIGDVLYGNIGVPTRIEFSVIGSAANEVCRMESLTKTLREPVVVSREFRAAHDIEYRHLGAHTLKGIGRSLEVFAPVFDATAQICDGCPSGRI